MTALNYLVFNILSYIEVSIVLRCVGILVIEIAVVIMLTCTEL
jgi:hypothetical protein